MKYFFIFFLILFSGSGANAQTISSRFYSVPDGLPQTQPWSIMQDNKGFIWICTKGGLARFDGLSFQTFTTEDGLNDNFVYYMSQASDGTIYVTNQRGLNYFDKGKFISIDYSKDYLDTYNRIIILPDDSIYYYRNQKFYRISGHKMIGPLFDHYKLWTVYNQYNTRLPQLFMYSSDGIYVLTKTEQLKKISSKLVNSSSFYCFNGSYYVEDFLHNLLFSFSPSGMVPLLNLRNNSITKINDHDYGTGYLQLYSNNLLFFDHYKVTSLPINVKNHPFFFCDRDENFWYGTQQGLIEISSQAFMNMESRLYDFPDIYNVCEDTDGSIWFFSYIDEVLRLKNNKILNLSYLKNNIKDTRIYSAQARDFDGNILLGTNMGLIKLTHNVLIQAYPQVKGVILYGMNDTLKDRIIFCGQSEGFFYLDRNGVKHGFKDRNPLKNTGLITCALTDKNNNYWISGKEGVSILEKDSIWVDLPCETMGFDKGAISMYRDSLDNIWLGSMDGLYYFDYKSFRKIASDIFTKQIGVLKYAGNNQLMIGTINGIGLLDLKEFYDKGTEKVHFFNQENGFSGIECRHNATFVDREGNLWICTSNKVVKFNPGLLNYRNKPPPLYLRTLSVRNKNQEWEQVINFDEDSISSFTTLNRDLRIGFVALDFAVPKRVQYRYRMTGFQDDWSTPQTDRFVYLGNLSPGNYTFEILASNGDNVWMKYPVTMSLTILPYFYETGLFKTVIIIFSLSLFFFFGYIISRRRLERHRKQELQRKELAKIQFQAISNLLDPHFIFNVLNSIGAVVFNNERENAYDYFTKFARLIRSSLEYSDVHIRPLREEIYFIKNFLDLEKLRFKDKFHYQVNLDDAVNRETPVPKMLLQTFTENAIRHGLMPKTGIGHLEIHIAKEKSFICISIEDDGIGRKRASEINSQSTGKGISLIQQYIDIFNRFNERKITFHIEDVNLNGEPGGTKVTIIIPDNYRYETET